jgi:hypothetical protein
VNYTILVSPQIKSNLLYLSSCFLKISSRSQLERPWALNKSSSFGGFYQLKFSLMKTLFSFVIILFAAANVSMAQSISSSASSSLPDSTIYFVEGKVLSGDALKQIPYSKIASVDVVKKDTVVNGMLYRARIYVRLKNEEYPKK